MKQPKNKKAKKLTNWSDVKKFLKEKPITKVERIDFIQNRFDKEEWTW